MATARLLDLTRSLRRAGRMATGVDRVELAYLDHFLTLEAPLFGLVRTALGYVVLERAGLQGLRDRLSGQVPWGPASLLSRLPRGRDQALIRAESDVRRLAAGRALPGKLATLLRSHLPESFEYFNVGHSDLTDRVLNAVRQAGGLTHVMIHDVIPLQFPQFQRPGTVAPFRAKLARVSRSADRVIYNSADTRAQAEAHMQDMGRVPPSIVSHLGTNVPQPDVAALPNGLPPDVPYFITVGTIEPRKNHAFLLDLWEEMGPSAPPLLICGSRGWNNAEVFARLDDLPSGSRIREIANLSDPALAALVQGAAGLLFPTHAEGYGLPPLEALALRTRVLCNDLPVLREIMGDKAVYASVSDGYLWINTIKEWGGAPPDTQTDEEFTSPTWANHFKTVLR